MTPLLGSLKKSEEGGFDTGMTAKIRTRATQALALKTNPPYPPLTGG